MEIMKDKWVDIKGREFLVTYLHEENEYLMSALLNKIMPNVGKPGKYNKINRICRKLGVVDYEISSKNDKVYCVILRHNLTRGVMYSGDRCFDFWDN